MVVFTGGIVLIYSGIAKYKDADIAFHFDELKLSLFPSYELYKEITMNQIGNGMWTTPAEKKPFTDGFLEGKVNGQPMFIHFFFSPTNYGTTTKNFFECEISIHPRDYIIYNTIPSFPLSCITLSYKSLKLHRFLGLIPKYDISADCSKGLCGKITCNTETTNLVSHSEIDGIDIAIKPSFNCSWGGARFKFTPELLFKLSSIPDENTLLKIYHSSLSLLKYAFMRNDIIPDSFSFQTENGIKGEIHSPYLEQKDFEPEDCNSMWRDSIPWAVFYKHAIDVLRLIVNDDWYLDNLPQNYDERLWVSDIVISKEAAAFEHEFSKSYPDGLPIHSEKRIQAENDVEAQIRPLFDSSSGKKREIYKGFLSHIRNDALGDKIEYCFDQNQNRIIWLKSKIAKDLNAEQLANICVSIRNDIDHGDKMLTINTDVARAYSMLRALVYAMQLNRIGFDDSDIDLAITNLYLCKSIGQ